MNKVFISFCITGMAVLLLIISGYADAQSCNNTDPGNTSGNTGCVSFVYRGQGVTYSTVRSADGKIWIRQNLGSSAVASSLTDTGAYGDLFQWGRGDDGHQLRNSALQANAPTPNNPSGLSGNSTGFYSAGYNSSANWWSGGAPDNQWTASSPSSVTAINGADPCKAIGAGWRLPTVNEIETVLTVENISDTKFRACQQPEAGACRYERLQRNLFTGNQALSLVFFIIALCRFRPASVYQPVLCTYQ